MKCSKYSFPKIDQTHNTVLYPIFTLTAQMLTVLHGKPQHDYKQVCSDDGYDLLRRGHLMVARNKINSHTCDVNQ